MARPVGVVTAAMGVAMGLCALFGGLWDGSWGEATGVAVAGTITLAIGSWMAWVGRGGEGVALRRREATLVVALIWLGAGVFGGLPFVIASGLDPIDATFEAISGFTTTGATILTDIEGTMSAPVLLWRSLIQWLGGMGIVVLFVAIFPNLGVGGKHMYRSEVPGHSAGGLVPRIRDTSETLWLLYSALTAAEVLVLWLLGMDLFEATCHAFTTMSTGGFSTRNASVAAFDSAAIEATIGVFMLFGGVNFALYYGAFAKRSLRSFIRSVEFRFYLGLVLVSTGLLTVAIRGNHGGDVLESLRYAFFMVATTITSTGYGTDDYMAYPPFALMLVLTLMFIGGSSGSTAGGIKISRLLLLGKTLIAQVRRVLRPQVVERVRLDGKALETDVLLEVAAFFFVYMVVMCVGSLLVTLTDGVPPETAFGAMLTSLSNMGPGPYYLDQDNFAAYSGIAKIWFSLAMVLGRLEFFTLLAILHPDFWRR